MSAEHSVDSDSAMVLVVVQRVRVIRRVRRTRAVCDRVRWSSAVDGFTTPTTFYLGPIPQRRSTTGGSEALTKNTVAKLSSYGVLSVEMSSRAVFDCGSVGQPDDELVEQL
ncbi:hypothetical protein PanWU01x14_067960 [Parasponia andersonii]|uniref:Uncharacterized protein n=1 Tax=Parasponia andersonii TaxID=3476 RepID=A0A2P5DF92_PARAD|nr:hypothetical protein PanWU01x14_067960 [Parasponia andersonii]